MPIQVIPVFLVVFAFVCLLAFSAPAAGEKRVALVIGNDIYNFETLPSLNNARRDAQGIAAKLKSLGFEVILKTDLSRKGMWRAMREFEAALSGADVGLVFYAGHGIASEGQNWLVPTNAELETEDDLPSESMPARRLLRAMNDAGTKLKIVILDACRDNPLASSRSVKRGLIIEEGGASGGTAMVYSASEGQVAADGPKGGHGVFTGELLKVLDRPGLSLNDVFQRTAKQVETRTGGKQTPRISSSVTSRFIFKPVQVAKLPDEPKVIVKQPVVTRESNHYDSGLDLEFWRDIKHSKDPVYFQAYLDAFPQGRFRILARIMRDRLLRAGADRVLRDGLDRDQPVKPDASAPAPDPEPQQFAPEPDRQVVENRVPVPAPAPPVLKIEPERSRVQASRPMQLLAPAETLAVAKRSPLGRKLPAFVKTRLPDEIQGAAPLANLAELEIEEMEAVMQVAVRSTINARQGPTTKTRRVDRLRGRSDVLVTGKVVGADWYRVVLESGETAFVYAQLLQDKPLDDTQRLADECDAGQIVSCSTLGVLHARAIGVPQDYTRAAMLLEKACEGGDLDGCHKAGTLHLNGMGVRQNSEKAVSLFRLACDGGQTIGCVDLGRVYQHALGMGRDNKLAETYYQRACIGGDMSGCNNLGAIFHVRYSEYERAADLYNRACDGGESDACHNLGYLYEQGLGVGRNTTEAARRFTRACNAGNIQSCHFLSFHYLTDDGVQRDELRAQQLSAYACENGVDAACSSPAETAAR